MSIDVCIIGGGISGLTAAKILNDNKIESCLFEASPSIGGRIQTDNIDGYLCDRGFQVLLPAYATAKKILNYKQLNLSFYPKGAITYSDSIEWFAAPFGMQKKWQIGSKIPTIYSDWIAFATEVLNSRYPKNVNEKYRSFEYIKSRYSDQLFNKFLRPFFQGVFLDLNCDASPSLFRYYWRLFAMGGAAVPANGIGDISNQLSQAIPKDQISCNSKVSSIVDNTVYFENGTQVKAKKIVLATDFDSTCKIINELNNTTLNDERSVSTYFYRTNKVTKLSPLNFIMDSNYQLQLSIPTLICKSYSANNDHLCMVTCLGDHTKNSHKIIQQLSSKIGDQVHDWDLIHYHHIKNAVPTKQHNYPQLNGYYFCGDWLSFGSIESSMKSGQYVANHIIKNSK